MKSTLAIFVVVVVCFAFISTQGTGVGLEKCDTNMCGTVKQCQECCQHNFMIDNNAAGEDVEKQHKAVDELCECYHNSIAHRHGN